jgi:hypothetical protein
VKVCEHGSLPPACAACGGQYPERRHVDFGSAWDGPVINQLEVAVNGATPVQIDDLKVCESCIRDAAQTLKMDDISAPALQKVLTELDQVKAMNASQATLIENLQRAVAAKDAVRKQKALA